MTLHQNVLIIFGRAPQDRNCGRFLHFLTRQIIDRGWTPEIADPEEIRLPVMTVPYAVYEDGHAPPAMETVARMLDRADSIIVASGEHNHGVPPGLKNLLDHFANTSFRKPTGIATYSVEHCGGVRSAIQLRIALGELGMTTVPTTFAVPQIMTSLGPDGAAVADSLNREFSNFIDELSWWGQAARRFRDAGEGQMETSAPRKRFEGINPPRRRELSVV